MNEPIDELHRDCIAARAWLSSLFEMWRDRISQWEPRPVPIDWQAGTRNSRER